MTTESLAVKPQSIFLPWRSFKRHHFLLIILIAVLFNALRIQYRIQAPFVGDEQIEVAQLQHAAAYLDMLPVLRKDPGKLPFGHYFYTWVCLHIFPSSNKYWLALPQLLIANACLLLLIRIDWHRVLALKNFSRISPVWINVIAGFILTMNSKHVEFSVRVRTYGVLSFVGILVFLFAWHVVRSKFRWKNIIFAILLLNYHYYVLIMMVSCLIFSSFTHLFELQKENLGGFRTWLVRMKPALITVGVSFICMAPLWIWFPKFSSNSGFDTHTYFDSGRKAITRVFSSYYAHKRIRVLTGPSVLAGSFLFALLSRVPLLFAGVLVILPTYVIYLLDLWAPYWFLPKQWIWVMPFWSVFVAACIWFAVCHIYELYVRMRRA